MYFLFLNGQFAGYNSYSDSDNDNMISWPAVISYYCFWKACHNHLWIIVQVTLSSFSLLYFSKETVLFSVPFLISERYRMILAISSPSNFSRNPPRLIFRNAILYPPVNRTRYLTMTSLWTLTRDKSKNKTRYSRLCIHSAVRCLRLVSTNQNSNSSLHFCSSAHKTYKLR